MVADNCTQVPGSNNGRGCRSSSVFVVGGAFLRNSYNAVSPSSMYAKTKNKSKTNLNFFLDLFSPVGARSRNGKRLPTRMQYSAKHPERAAPQQRVT